MIESNSNDPILHKAGVPKLKKATPRIDMTPMVDLGFLLIAFFIFTTELSKPTVTNLFMPYDSPDFTEVPGSKSVTILLGAHDKVFYYSGTATDALKNKQVFSISYNEITGIGHCIRQKQDELQRRAVNRKELVVLIKPGNDCTYKNVLDALDEMLINGVSRYALVDPTKDESAFLTQN